jgi:hypothetical protein
VFALVRVEPSGSIDGVGTDFQPFAINDLEMVNQNSASWNPMTSWLRRIDALRSRCL